MRALAQDSFTRANETPLAAPWTDGGQPVTFNLIANALTSSDLNNDCAAFNTRAAWPANQYSQCQGTVTGTAGGGSGVGPGVRMATGRNSYAITIDHAATNNVVLAKFVGGTVTVLWTRTQAFTNGDILSLEVVGTTLIGRVNGTAIGAAVTDAALATGSPGVYYSSVETAASVDNWEGGELTQPYQPWTQRAPILAI